MEDGAHLELTTTTTSALTRVTSEACVVVVGCSSPPGSGAADTARSTPIKSGMQWFPPSPSQPPMLSLPPSPSAPSSVAHGSTRLAPAIRAVAPTTTATTFSWMLLDSCHPFPLHYVADGGDDDAQVERRAGMVMESWACPW